MSNTYSPPSGPPPTSPPAYDLPQEAFDTKLATATERSLYISYPPPNAGTTPQEDEFEDWDEAKFIRAQAAYQARLARLRGEPASSGSGSQPATPNAASATREQDRQPPLERPRTAQSPRSSIGGPRDILHRSQNFVLDGPGTGQHPIPVAPPMISSSEAMPTPLHIDRSTLDPQDTPGSAVPASVQGLQRHASLFRVPSMRRDHGEDLPAFTELPLPEQIVPESMNHDPFAAPPGPPPPPLSPEDEPQIFTPRAHPTGLPVQPRLSASPLSSPPAAPPAVLPPAFQFDDAPTDAPPAFPQTARPFVIQEKVNPYADLKIDQNKVMSRPMTVYASAGKPASHAPSIQLDLSSVYSTNVPDLPSEKHSVPGGSFYSSAVNSSFSKRPLPKPKGPKAVPSRENSDTWQQPAGYNLAGYSQSPPPPQPQSQPQGYFNQPQTSHYAPSAPALYQPNAYQQPTQQNSYYTQPQSYVQPAWTNQYPPNAYGAMSPQPAPPPSSWGAPQAGNAWSGHPAGQYHPQ